MRHYTIDPTQLNDTSARSTLLKNYLAHIINTAKSPFIKHGDIEIFYDKQIISIHLQHNLLIRPREHETNEKRVEVLTAFPFAVGKKVTSIYKSLGVLIPEDGYHFKERNFDKSRLCKIVRLFSEDERTELSQEAQYTQLNPLLHCKSALFSKTRGFLVMRRVWQKDLFDFINEMYGGKIPLTVEQRLQITIAILKAIKEQVHDLEMIHNDIKPENMIINWKNGSATITVIDYGFAKPTSYVKNDDINVWGTPGYLAPEFFSDEPHTIKSDLFALGITLAEFWGDLSLSELRESDLNLEDLLNFQIVRTWKGLFRGLQVPESVKTDLLLLFNGLTKNDPKARISLDQAIQDCELTLKVYKEEQENESIKIKNFSIQPAFFSHDAHRLLVPKDTVKNLISDYEVKWLKIR